MDDKIKEFLEVVSTMSLPLGEDSTSTRLYWAIEKAKRLLEELK